MKAELKTLKCDKECSLNAEGYCQSEMVIKGKSCDRRNNEGEVKITKIQPKKEPKLKIVDKIVTLKGEYETYIVTATGVTIQGNNEPTFCSESDVEDYRKNMISMINNKADEMLQALSYR